LVTLHQKELEISIKAWDTTNKIIKSLTTAIMKSASIHHFETVRYCTTGYQAMKAIDTKLNPTYQEKELELRAQWAKATSGIPRNATVEQWVAEVIKLITECENIAMPEVTGNRTMNAVTKAIRDSSPDDHPWAEFKRLEYLKEVKDPVVSDKERNKKTVEILTEYRTLRRERNSEAAVSGRRQTPRHSAFPTYQGEHLRLRQVPSITPVPIEDHHSPMMGNHPSVSVENVTSSQIVHTSPVP
jgi:hypothetical protein